MDTVAAEIEDFSIKTKVFEGPLELLLELVEKRKLLINDIALAEVTDEYMRRVSLMQAASLPNTAQFVALAATLLLIKSKSLLPVLDLTEEESASIDDLEDRLKLYKIYREAADVVESRFGKNLMHGRQFVPQAEPVFTPDAFTDTKTLEAAMWSVINSLPQNEVKPKVQVRPTVSIEEMIERLHRRIEQQLTVKFSELVAGESEHGTVIVGFLAILESVKQGSVVVGQTSRFADIDIKTDTPATPRYR